MAKTQVLLVGAAGETGGSIANGLIEDGSFVRKPLLKPFFAIYEVLTIDCLCYRTFTPLSAPSP
jgi:hypothetical protein